jgi:hypothetical protein
MSTGDFLQVGIDILNTYLGASETSPTGTILAQTGDVLKQFTDCDQADWWQHVGFASRPSNVTAGKAACQGVAFRASDRDVVICSRDTRTNQIYGNLGPGETCLFGAGADGESQGRVIVKDDGSVTLATTDDNTSAGNMTYLRIHPTKGLTFVAPWGSIVFDEAGLRIKHDTGFSATAGGIGGLPGGLSSYFKISAALTTVEGSTVFLGAGLAGYSPVAWGFAENPLTMPLVPICPAGFGIPCGLFTSNSVRAGT